MSARAEKIHEAVDDIALDHRSLVAARLAGGINGATIAHSSSLRSLG
jgi:hypothetical protein